MEKKLSILIYEKEKNLNIILKEQFSKFEKYEICITDDEEILLNLIKTMNIDVCVLNIEDLNLRIPYFIKTFQSTNKDRKIIGYYEKEDDSFLAIENEIVLLNKPFKLITLFEHLDNIKNITNKNKNYKYLMRHLEFIPIKKIITNLNTKNKEHLTEKETNLLNYLYNKKTLIYQKWIYWAIFGELQRISIHTP